MDTRDVIQNAYECEFAAERGWRPPPALQEGDIVLINRYGSISFLNERTTGDGQAEIAKFLGPALEGDLAGVQQIRQQLTREAEIVRDPELREKSFQELRELLSELNETRRGLREQLADEELLPTQREALEKREVEVINRQTDVRLTIQEMCAAQPMLLRDEFAPFLSTEGERMSRDTGIVGLMRTAGEGADMGLNALGSVADAVANALGEGVIFLADSFGGGHSLPTQEVIAARREAAENRAANAEAKVEIRAQYDRQQQTNEQVRQVKEAEEEEVKRRRGENDFEYERGR